MSYASCITRVANISNSDYARCFCKDLIKCSTHQLGSNEYQLTDGSASGTSDSSESLFSNFITLRADLDTSAGANSSLSGYIIREVCNGAENVNPLMFSENTGLCDTEVDMEGNQLILYNCTDRMVDEGDLEIIIRNCTNCMEVYIAGG